MTDTTIYVNKKLFVFVLIITQTEIGSDLLSLKQTSLLTLQELIQGVVCVTHHKHRRWVQTSAPQILIGQQSPSNLQANMCFSCVKQRKQVSRLCLQSLGFEKHAPYQNGSCLLHLCLTSAWRSLYDGQLLSEGQPEGFHLGVIELQFLLLGPVGFSQAVKGRRSHLVLPRRVGNALKVVCAISSQVSWRFHIFVALDDVPGEMMEKTAH